MTSRAVAFAFLAILVLVGAPTGTAQSGWVGAHSVSAGSDLESAAQPPSTGCLTGGRGKLGSYIAISFSDGLQSAYTYGYRALRRYMWRGVAFIPTSQVGRLGHMSTETLHKLDALGWDVASHLDKGADCTQLPPDELYARLVLSHDWLTSHGFVRGARTFSPPALKWNRALTPLAVLAGYEVVIVGQNNGGLVPPPLTLEIVGCANRRDIGYISQAIDMAASTPGTLLALSFHDIVVSDPVDLESDITRLYEVLALVAASGLPVVTMSDLLDENMERRSAWTAE